MPEPREVARLDGAGRSYARGGSTLVALHPTDLLVGEGELILVAGPSGSGKTTLLALLGLVTEPSVGRVLIGGVATDELGPAERARTRLRSIGFIFQEFNLVAPLSASENVALPLLFQGIPLRERKRRATEALAALGLADRGRDLPRALSGGQRQRVAIARALVSDPILILCDEPTASLDRESGTQVMERLRGLTQEKRGVVVVTHDLRLATYAHRIVHLVDGRVVGQEEGGARSVGVPT